MAEVTNFNTSEQKEIMDIDWGLLFDDSSDDHTPELIITSSEKSNCAGETEQEDDDYSRKTVSELKAMILKYKGYISTLGHKTPDNGEKLKATIRRCEAELNRRSKIGGDKVGFKCEKTVQLSDQSDDDRKDRKSLASSTFASILSKKIDENSKRTVNAFEKELSFFNPHQGRKTGQNSNLGRSSQQSSSRAKNPFKSPTAHVDNKKPKISDADKKVICSATSSLHHFFTNRRVLFPCKPSSYHLVDEDIEDPFVSNTTLYAEKLTDCMKDVKVYYPSRHVTNDRDPIEVIYTDMECLAPEACLSSNIMNFYIRYLQQSSSENRICNYHVFNTYFYNKLQKLNYREDSFLRFRKWWRSVNIFQKAYILLPIHESAHWSLGIICIPTKEDELGPIVLHLDSLGLHDSCSIFDKIKRFVKEEWSYLRNSNVPLDLPIMDEIWENLDHMIIDRKMQVVPQQRNTYDCGLFVLYYMERFIEEAPERLTEKDLSMFGKQWFHPEEASNLRVRIHNLLVQEFKMAKDKETILSPKC
ncbi:hypothetical protein E3N88_40748 [Mikania micrantha]|uniref:Ubiquitin-like protease family profile domain-containing protein n=1 Tax=Mikania micrantha TaxID=192012 RepID=A0A5N6LPH9_9ASTR|nr:hypothetical protein E3N88_40748 [Mikania micrantha]